METGIGAEATRRALEWLLSRPGIPPSLKKNGQVGNLTYEPGFIIYVGFAGALTDDLSVGDVVLATEVRDLDGNRWPAAPLLENATARYRRGAILSSPHMVGDPQMKRELGRVQKAVAVDMESATFARVCTERGVRFACGRVISDDINTSLSPQLVSLLAGGRASPWRVLWALVRRPTLVKEFMRLGRDTRLASERLGVALAELLN